MTRKSKIEMEGSGRRTLMDSLCVCVCMPEDVHKESMCVCVYEFPCSDLGRQVIDIFRL